MEPCFECVFLSINNDIILVFMTSLFCLPSVLKGSTSEFHPYLS
ncbi:hypothetical protein ABID39_001541 [Bartonella japonica]|uniref:Palindromic element RPE4 domain-containing protein n=1 Tax=Bartonella japonica TaxID=357761 RepID=A0ABV2FQS6_9HYPH